MAMRAVVADDHVLVRQGIVRILVSLGIDVVGEARTGFEALEQARTLKPDVVILDLMMPAMDGIAATRLICRELPDTQVIILTMSESEEDLLAAVQAGARGYVTKDTDAASLVQQVRQVLAGGVAISEANIAKLVSGLVQRPTLGRSQGQEPFETLTEREREVLALVSRGESNKAIGASLYITENTARAHVRSLMQKLGVDNRTQLAVIGVREGLASPTRMLR